MLERMATQLDGPIGYAYSSEGDSFYEVEIHGGREGVEELREHPTVRWDDPYLPFRLVQILELQPGERIVHTNLRLGRAPSQKDPVVDILAGLHWEAVQFNRHQGRRRIVTLDADWLEQILTEAAQRSLEDARALAAAASIGDSIRPPESRTTYLLIELYRATPRFVSGAYSHATYIFVPNPEGLERVQVTLVYRIDPLDPDNLGSDLNAVRSWFQQLSLPGQQRDYHYGSGELRPVLARMLGHTVDELQLSYPD
jgi:hypothetical protein